MWTMLESQPSEINDVDNAGFDLMHYWYLFWHNKLLIIFFGVLFAIPTAFYMKAQVSTYVATASLLIERNEVNLTSIENLYGIDSQSMTYTNTQFELLRSRSIAERVIRDLNLLGNPDFVPQSENEETESESLLTSLLSYIPKPLTDFLGLNNEPESSQNVESSNNSALLALILNNFNRSLNVTPVINTSIVKISFTATHPQLAADIANQIAVAFIEADLEQRITATQQAGYWLSERVASLNETLQESEEKLQNYMEREELVDVDGVNSMNAQELDQLNTQLINAQNIRSGLESLYRQIQNLENSSTDSLLRLPQIQNNPLIQTAMLNVEELDREYAELSNRYGRNHPTMISLTAEIGAAKSQFSNLVSQLVDTIKSDYQRALENEDSIQARLDRSIADLQSVNRKSFELRELEREVETNRQLYDMFFTRIRETQETDDLQTTNAVIVDPAVPPLEPTGPQRKRNVLLALIAGLMMGGGLVLLRDILDNTIKNHNEIETSLRSHVLGVIPYIERSKSEKKEDKAFLGFIDNTQSQFSESLRTIRTSITLSSLDNPYTIISVTSSLPDEGKTTVSINLASVMGQMGKVLLIETDLRKPTIARTLNLPPQTPGLANYLAGNNELKDCLFHEENGNFTVMPAGQQVPNPLELLSSEKFKSLLKNLKSNYSHIILDTPPSQAVSDPLIVGNIADAVVFVVKAETTPTKLAKNQLKRLRKGANVIGVVLNQLEISKNSDYGGYYDSYGYAERTSPAS